MHDLVPPPRVLRPTLMLLSLSLLTTTGCADDPFTPPGAASPAATPTASEPPGTPTPSGGAVPIVTRLSDVEREAVKEMISRRGAAAEVLLALVDDGGQVAEMTVPAGEVEAVADRLAADGTTVAVSSLVYPADDEPGVPDPELLFAGKEIFGLEAWSSAHPHADGRGVKIAVVDDGVALRRPGLEETSVGTPKITKVINTASTWLLPLYPAGHSCRREAGSAGISADWEIDGALGIPEASAHTLRVPFDLTPCGINPYLNIRPSGCEPWDPYFPNAASRRVNGVLRVAALYVEFPADEGTRRRVLVDVDGDGKITTGEALAPVSDAGGHHLAFADGTAMAFDVHASSAIVPAAPGSPGNDVAVCPQPAPRTLTIALPQIAASHGEGVAAIAAGHRIAGQSFDGMAPGAEVVDVEFATATSTHPYSFAEIARALQTAGKNADIVNLSYSLYFSSPAAQVGMRRVLESALGPTGALYFFSAGNNGPGRSSMNRALLYPSFGVPVAAYLDPLLSQTTFGSVQPIGGVVAYSSRGPGYDGASGALLLSPLAGIVSGIASSGPSPFSGTSSATPALAGFSARVLSQIRAENLRFSRDLFRRALIEGAAALPGVPWIDQGYGIPRLMDVMSRYRALIGTPKPPPALDISGQFARDGLAQKGIHVRDREGRLPQYGFRIAPLFAAGWTPEDRARYSAELALVSSAPWLRVPPAAIIGRSAIAVDVSVDWAALDGGGGGEHLGEIQVLEVVRGEDGSIAERRPRGVIPATVLLPGPGSGERGYDAEVSLPANGMVRRYLTRPSWASHLVVSAETASPEQVICGGFVVYNPDGTESTDTRIGGPFRAEGAFTATVPGTYELVVEGERSHRSCGSDQRLLIRARWIQIELVRHASRPLTGPTPRTAVEVLVTTRAPLQMGTVNLAELGESFRVDLNPSGRPWEWKADRPVDLSRFTTFGFRFDPAWLAERAHIPSIIRPFLWLVPRTAGQEPVGLPLLPGGQMFLLPAALLPPADAASAELSLGMFDIGSDPAVQPGRIPIIGHGTTLALSMVTARASNVQLSRLEPRTLTVTLPAPLAEVRGKTAMCTFQPLDFQVSVPCGTLEIW